MSIRAAAVRWKYRFIVWFISQPDALARRVAVEMALECRTLAIKLGVPRS